MLAVRRPAVVFHAQGARPVEPDAPLSLPGAAGEQAQSLGLPSDWRFVAPTEWNTVDATIAARLNPALRDNSPIELGGIRVMRSSGKIETGQLDPVGQSVEIPAALAGIVTPADEALSLEASIAILIVPGRSARARRAPLLGPLPSGGALYEGKTFCRCALIVAKMAESAAVPPTAIKPLIDALSELVPIRTPAHQFRWGGASAIAWCSMARPRSTARGRYRPRPYRPGGDRARQAESQAIRRWTFRPPARAAAGGHRGRRRGRSDPCRRLLAGFNVDGSRWPSKATGRAITGTWQQQQDLHAHLIAIDYSAGVEDEIRGHSQGLLSQRRYVGLRVRHPRAVRRSGSRSQISRLHVTTARRFRPTVGARCSGGARTLDEHTFFEKHGAFYCAEGQYVVAISARRRTRTAARC